MKDLILRILNKRGIQSVDELDKDEKETLEGWQKTLSKEELTLDDLKQFCETQVSIIENRWSNYDISQEKKNSLIPYHTVYKAISNAIASPRSAREALEKNLLQILEQ